MFTTISCHGTRHCAKRFTYTFIFNFHPSLYPIGTTVTAILQMKKFGPSGNVCPVEASLKLQSQDSNPGYLTLKPVFLSGEQYGPMSRCLPSSHSGPSKFTQWSLRVRPWCPRNYCLTKKARSHKLWGILQELGQGHMPVGLYHSASGKAEGW